LNEEGNFRAVKGIPREIFIKQFSALLLKKSSRKVRQIFATHMEETHKNKVTNIEYYVVLK